MITNEKSNEKSKKSAILKPGESTEETNFQGNVTITNQSSNQKALVKIWNPLTGEVFEDRKEVGFDEPFIRRIETVQAKVEVKNQSQAATILVNFA